MTASIPESPSPSWQKNSAPLVTIPRSSTRTACTSLRSLFLQQLPHAVMPSLAPLHQPHNLAAIRVINRLLPALPQVASFDTSFHATQDWVSQAYALPRRVRDALSRASQLPSPCPLPSPPTPPSSPFRRAAGCPA